MAPRRGGSDAWCRPSGTGSTCGSWIPRQASSCENICARAAASIASRPRTAPRAHRSTEALLRRAHFAGSHIGMLCEQIHRCDGEPGVRRILGVLSLAKKHGPAVVEDAAEAALELGAPSYRFLRRYLERRPPAPVSLRQVDPLIRQLTLYRDLIDKRTGEQT